MESWRTTIAGILVITAGIATLCLIHGTVGEVQGVALITAGIGLVVAKDSAK